MALRTSHVVDGIEVRLLSCPLINIDTNLISGGVFDDILGDQTLRANILSDSVGAFQVATS